jgi:6-phosphogluconolactonase (cycloisomerase 2 family)
VTDGELSVFVGCYTTPDRKGRGEGITAYRMDQRSGEWRPLGTVAREENPSFLALDPTQRFLYCVHGGGFSDVSAFAIADSGTPTTLAPLGKRASGGVNPVHLAVHPGGRWLVVANYIGGTVAVLPVHQDGALGDPSDVVTLSGECGPEPVEQSSPHPHDIPFDPSGQFVAVPDKALDRVFIFRLDTANGRFVPASPAWVASQPGAGPRHIAFHPERLWAYCINELNSTVTAFGYASDGDGLRAFQTISSLPPDVSVRSTGAEVVVHPSGRFVYVSNRGYHSVGVFGVDPQDGSLRPVGWEPTQGDTPRAIALDPSGRFLYAANQASDTIVGFRVDEASGKLSPTGQTLQTGSPSSMVFVERA